MKLPRPQVDRNGFLSRSPETSRLEGFSDAVFGFSLTLLVVALEVPKTFDDLIANLRGFVAFGFSFAMLYYVWNLHYLVCRRFGLEDTATRVLTGMLLFVVALYVYPLKFLSTLFFGSLLGFDRHNGYSIRPTQMPALFQIYSLGFVLIFGLIGLMYAHAYQKREELEMDEIERVATRGEMGLMAIMAGVGLLSFAIAGVVPGEGAGTAGFIYFLIGPLAGWQGAHTGRKVRALGGIAERLISDRESAGL